MDPEKMLEIINKVRSRLKQEPMSLEQYNAIVSADNEVTRRHIAAREAGRQHRIRGFELSKKYPVKGSPLGRCYYFLMKEEKTPEDIEYNKNIAEKANTPEGSAELFEEIVRRAAQLPPSVFFPKDDAEMISNYEKYGGLMDALFTMNQTRRDLDTKFGIKVSPEVENFLNNHTRVFELCGKTADMVNLWASPYYPFFSEPDVNTMSGIILTGVNHQDKNVQISSEQAEFNIFADNIGAPINYEAEKEVMEGGRKLVESDQLNDHKYAAEDINNAAKKAGEGSEPDKKIKLKTMDEKEREALNKELSGRFAMTDAQKEAKDAREVLDKGAFSENSMYSFDSANDKLIKLFGPKFEYAEDNLKERVYTRENFKVTDYELPEGCPFSEKEAAVIALCATTLKGIGDLSRTGISESYRISANYDFGVENMISGSPRTTLGPLLQPSIDAARKKASEIIKAYMSGDKKPLAEALSSGISLITESHLVSNDVKRVACFDGEIMKTAMNMIERDSKVKDIVRENGLLGEKEADTAKLGTLMSRYFEERTDCLNRFYDELKKGKLPSDELKQELITKMLTFNLISGQKAKDNSAYFKTEDYIKEYNEIQKWFKEVSKKLKNKTAEELINNSDMEDFNGKIVNLNRKHPVSDFNRKLIRSGGLETLENMVKGSDFAKELMEKPCQELVRSLQLNEPRPDFTDMTINLREELKDLKPFTEKIAMDIKNPYTPATRESIAEDIQILSELGKGMEEAQKNVHMGSGEFDKVVKDIKLLEEAGKGLRSGQYLLDGKNAGNMRLMYAGLQKHCEAYLARKEKQGLLDADPQSKPGKRIKMVREVLKFSQQGEARFGASEEEAKTFRSEADKTLYDSLTPGKAAELIKNLNDYASKNSDPETGEKIVSTLKLTVKYMQDKKVEPEDVGLQPDVFKKSIDVIKKGGVGKKPEKTRENTNSRSNEIRTIK